MYQVRFSVESKRLVGDLRRKRVKPPTRNTGEIYPLVRTVRIPAITPNSSHASNFGKIGELSNCQNRPETHACHLCPKIFLETSFHMSVFRRICFSNENIGGCRTIRSTGDGTV
jgi:hypothetical protein